MQLLDLPVDILLIVVSLLGPSDLLALCSTNRALHEDEAVRFSSTYWRSITRRTFRLPNQLITEHDGRRWMQLYRRMRTQTKVYTWGKNDKGCLGGGIHLGAAIRLPNGPAPHLRRGVRMQLDPQSRSWPGDTRMGDLGVVADLQSGGWSNTALNSKGQLFTVGLIDGSVFGQSPSPVPHQLSYPTGFVAPGERYDAYTAIQQFSAGRSHILGLSDAGRIWSWDDTRRPGLHIKFLSFDLTESQAGNVTGKVGAVTKVVAGWARSSAYVRGKGIVVWEPSNNAEVDGASDQSMTDGMLVLENWIVPATNYTRPQNRDRDQQHDDSNAGVGEVTNWIVLEAYVLFTTDNGGLYASSIPDTTNGTFLASSASTCLNPDPGDSGEQVVDIQGSFRSFAVFKKNGTVLIGDQDYVHARLGFPARRDTNGSDHVIGQATPSTASKLRRVPCLQDTGVISMAFGDWHFHALHRDGTISSYGHEPTFCGALGLGGTPMRPMRGMLYQSNLSDSMLLEECMTSGRRVSFEPEKVLWLEWCGTGGEASEMRQESKERIDMMARAAVKAEVSEWFEERLRRWEEDAPVRNEEATNEGDEDDDGLPAYFALSVAAAGWHSGALVLVNEGKAKKIRERYYARLGEAGQPSDGTSASVFQMAKSFITSFAGADECREQGKPQWVWEVQEETFPRLKLKSGETMPGDVNVLELPEHLRDWKAVELVDL